MLLQKMRVKPIKKTDKQYKQKDPVQKAGARKTVSVPAVILPGLFLHILKLYDMIKQTDKLEFDGRITRYGET